MARKPEKLTSDIKDAIYNFAGQTYNDIGPISVRAAYYHVVTLGLVDKTHAGYIKVQRLMTPMRENGELPWEWVHDPSRQINGDILRSGFIYEDTTQRDNILGSIRSTVREGQWTGQKNHVQIWYEKEGMTGIVSGAIKKLFPWGGVQYVACKGRPSISLLDDLAPIIARHLDTHDVHIFYFGDHDPSGLESFFGTNEPDCNSISKKLPRYVDRYLEGNETGQLHLDWSAISLTDIERYDLPKRELKENTQKERYPYNWAVEIDALPVNVLQEKIHTCIKSVVDLSEIDNVNRRNYERNKQLEDLRQQVSIKLDELSELGYNLDNTSYEQ